MHFSLPVARYQEALEPVPVEDPWFHKNTSKMTSWRHQKRLKGGPNHKSTYDKLGAIRRDHMTRSPDIPKRFMSLLMQSWNVSQRWETDKCHLQRMTTDLKGQFHVSRASNLIISLPVSLNCTISISVRVTTFSWNLTDTKSAEQLHCYCYVLLIP